MGKSHKMENPRIDIKWEYDGGGDDDDGADGGGDDNAGDS